MFAHAVRLAAVAVAFVTASAQADVLVDFGNLPSYVHAAVSGYTIDASAGVSGVRFDAVGWSPFDPSYAYFTGIDQFGTFYDSLPIAGVYATVDWPNGMSEPPVWTYGSVADAVHTYTYDYNNGHDILTGMRFDVMYLNNVTLLGVDPVVPSGDPAGTVPLPGTLALLGAGALAMRRRRGK